MCHRASESTPPPGRSPTASDVRGLPCTCRLCALLGRLSRRAERVAPGGHRDAPSRHRGPRERSAAPMGARRTTYRSAWLATPRAVLARHLPRERSGERRSPYQSIVDNPIRFLFVLAQFSRSRALHRGPNELMTTKNGGHPSDRPPHHPCRSRKIKKQSVVDPPHHVPDQSFSHRKTPSEHSSTRWPCKAQWQLRSESANTFPGEPRPTPPRKQCRKSPPKCKKKSLVTCYFPGTPRLRNRAGTAPTGLRPDHDSLSRCD
ncbi:hypothetical protein SAMN04489718_1458 [Actinopolyspora saharensis]|uniref:Uncharacterized protein n=1 Tax=Actinopolyspora saharensis TaxID=995062 RepID=A0A1H1A7Z1_9ACTN|nr:hypothetical protein SAMN04489718_1458 [Actinopolyspora saharensis]